MNPQLPQNEIRKHIYSIPPLLLAESENMLKKVPRLRIFLRCMSGDQECLPENHEATRPGTPRH